MQDHTHVVYDWELGVIIVFARANIIISCEKLIFLHSYSMRTQKIIIEKEGKSLQWE